MNITPIQNQQNVVFVVHKCIWLLQIVEVYTRTQHKQHYDLKIIEKNIMGNIICCCNSLYHILKDLLKAFNCLFGKKPLLSIQSTNVYHEKFFYPFFERKLIPIELVSNSSFSDYILVVEVIQLCEYILAPLI